ncbi:MAG: phosphohydrolase [Chloroflexi bacterium]|nr:phosphohydrolase [Chloroflexota bacterium]MDA8186826.1 hypothetical protein [Dehalococcoidales bacterium]
MTINKFCPGSTTIKSPVPEYIECPWCKGEVEIWSDEIKTTCPNCKATVFKNKAPSCIDWCKHAEECIGTEAFKRLKGPQS